MTWLHDLWFHYFWPSDMGNGPEAIQQTVLYGALAYVFVPPVRRWVNGHFKGVKDHAQALHDAREDEAERRHQEALQLARRHHDEHMRALGATATTLTARDFAVTEVVKERRGPTRDARGRFAKGGDDD